MEMKETASAEAHLREMKELTDKLAAVGAPITEEDQVVTLLGSLPKKYSTLATALEARAGDNLSLSYVHQALIHEEQKIGGSSCPTDGQQLQVDQKALAGWQPRQVRCYGCGEVGHIHRFCPHKKTTQNASPAKEKEGDERVGAFAASVKLPGGTRWLVDSGASSHMTQERNILTD